MESTKLKRQLEAHAPELYKILRSSGSPGLFIGAFHHGHIIHTQHFGLRDSTRSETPDDDSIYCISSLSKLLAVCAISALVHDGLLDWDLPIHHYLPGLQCRKDAIGTQATLRDLASNQTGLPAGNMYWIYER
jgi:CubicO group peptidase (beta-lactamase class C family)